MNRYLVYLSPKIVNDDSALKMILDDFNQIGRVAPADFHIYIVETDADGATVYQSISNNTGNTSSFFVAEVNEIGYQGQGDFTAAIGLLSPHKRRQQ